MITPAAYMALAREIESRPFSGLKVLKTAVLSTFTADLLKPYLIAEGARRGLKLDLYFAPFNQLEQQILNEQSGLYHFNPDVVILAARQEDLISQGEDPRFGLLRLKSLVAQARRQTHAGIFAFNFPGASQDFNAELVQICNTIPDIYVFDCAAILDPMGTQAYDPKLWQLAKMPFTAEAQIRIAKQLARDLRAYKVPPCKCLVLDLDNTLWEGILGENGSEGIIIHKDFQNYLLSLRQRGIMLALASKNTEAEALEVFSHHPNMVLKLNDFSARQIHWNDKAQSLRAIAKELNIGTDALAFFDDSPVEREWIKSQMPEVTVIDVPEKVGEYVHALDEFGVFDQLVISEEDRNRADLYRHEEERKILHAQTVSLEDFLQKLQITVLPEKISNQNLQRVTQLINKTNQFNLTTLRYTAAELLAFLDADHVSLALRVQDRFGDYGLVGVCLVKQKEIGAWSIDTLLLSCRVLGRKVETVFLSLIAEEVRQRHGRLLRGIFRPTAKNAPAKDFYKDHHFSQIDSQTWELDLSKNKIPIPEFITVRFKND